VTSATLPSTRPLTARNVASDRSALLLPGCLHDLLLRAPAGARGCVGPAWGNAPFDGLAEGLLVEELGGALVRDPEHLSDVAHGEASASELARELSAAGAGLLAQLVRAATRQCHLLDLPVQVGNARLDADIDATSRCLEPQRNRVTDELLHLVEPPSLREHTRQFGDADRPPTALVSFGPCRVGAHLNQPSPRHGARCFSIDRSVPGAISPEWIGMTVWHDPHRTTRCEPLWRTSSQPARRNKRRSCPVLTTVSLYS